MLAFAALAAAHAIARAETIGVGGVTRSYVAHVPQKLPAHPALVLAFHGHGGNGAGMERLSGLDAPADRNGFIVVYPDGMNHGWNDGRSIGSHADDTGFVTALIAAFAKQYAIDPHRVYAAGFSNGATFTQVLGCRFADRFAAIAPVEGTMPAIDRAGCRPQRALSVLEIGGTADPIMPFAGGQITLPIFGQRGEVLSVADTVAFWASNAGCARAPAVFQLPAVEPADGTSVTRKTFPGCRGATGVVEYDITGGGHTWPGGRPYFSERIIGKTSNQLDAAATIAAFFLAHPQPK